METVDVPSYWTKGLVRNVDTDTDYYKIQHAIDNDSAGDTLNVWAWTYYDNIEIDEELMIIGNGTANTTINGNWEGSVVNISSDSVTIRSFSVTASDNSTVNPYYGAGVRIYSEHNTIDFLVTTKKTQTLCFCYWW